MYRYFFFSKGPEIAANLSALNCLTPCSAHLVNDDDALISVLSIRVMTEGNVSLVELDNAEHVVSMGTALQWPARVEVRPWTEAQGEKKTQTSALIPLHSRKNIQARSLNPKTLMQTMWTCARNKINYCFIAQWATSNWKPPPVA